MKPVDLGLPARFPSFRSYAGFDQLAVAQDLARGFADRRFQLAQLPTGAGKSLTSAAVAALLAQEKTAHLLDDDCGPADEPFRWLVLTGTKGLQAQYLDDGLAQCSVVGHRNYPCMPSYQRLSASAEDPDDPEFRCLAIPRDTCGYTIDTTKARESSGVAGVVGNYAHWLSLGRYSDPRLLGDFDLVVLDEAHSSREWLTRAMQIYLSPFQIGKVLGINGPYRMPTPSTHAKVEDWYEWLTELSTKVEERYEELAAAKDVRGANRAGRLAKELALLRIAASPEDREYQQWTEPWVVIPQDQRPGYVFSPRWGADFAERYLFRDIPRVLLTSATVTPQHAKQLGIPSDQMRFREVPSPFDPRRRPVIWVPTTRVDFRMTDGQRWLLMRRIDQVIEAAIEQGAGNGVIHTGSYERMREIAKNSRYAPAIITHEQNSADFQAQLARFKAAGQAGRFAVIASPRMVEGVDLVDDLCVAEGSRVLTRDMRWVPIEEIRAGQELVAIDENKPGGNRHRKLRYAEVVEKRIRREYVFRVVTGKGEVLATAEHRFLTKQASARNMWMPVSRMRKGWHIYWLTNPVEFENSYRSGYLAGIFDGEGHLSSATRGRNSEYNSFELGISQRPGIVWDQALRFLREMGYEYAISHCTSHAKIKNDVQQAKILGRMGSRLNLISQTRPVRMIQQCNLDGKSGKDKYAAEILAIEPAGRKWVVDIQTTTGTYFVEGFASHNCRWQFILKLPFPDSRDPLTAARAKDRIYRDLCVSENVTQMIGRLVRNDQDFGTTIIGDDHWVHVRNSGLFAQWLRAAFRKVDPEEMIELLTKEKVEKLGPRPVEAAPQVVQFIQP